MTATKTQTHDLEKLREMVKDIDFCMLTTVDGNGDLRSRPMSANGEIDPNGDLWFFTGVSSQKVSEVANSSKVNVSFTDPKNQHYVSITGVAELIRDRRKIDELWKPEFMMWFPEGKDDPEIALLRIRLEKGEYWVSPSSTIGYALSFVSALVTGKQPEFGENKKVEF
ncbi:MAG: pyridoxamine 5'-phosphate oxidase family protein [Acidobacteriota bacterium]|nr:pyridoxamine 5'-phosphate oxidase family protein [Acidobacteriota bacterium]